MSNGIELMQHALGISERNRTPYRNYFLAGEGHTDNEKWKELVSEERETGRYKYEYRMIRRSRAYWDSYCDIRGDWKPTKKAAKASYKEALRKSKESAQ
ncbi:hypothetical protein QF02_003909 [Salmonella enterica subsp. enterica]|nr:hypothetical protein [Salmonella enterica subsp. enterica serovar Lexington]